MKVLEPISVTYDHTWSLFLDRDGVINQEIVGNYITHWDDFLFYENTVESLVLLSKIFGNIFVVTNQRGVGKGIMSSNDLIYIHENMKNQIIAAGGKIDQIYACTAIHDEDSNRKPNIGMGLQAKEDFESVDFKKSVMVGNNLSDMLFGKRLQMKTVFISSTNPAFDLPHDLIDEQYDSLAEWTEKISISKNNATLTSNSFN
jgi:D-glycero-D-manno-heptose 1,7-bisphosphate phosphatase